MQVKDLIAQLQTLNPEALVVQAEDAEGNNYTPLYSVVEGVYEAQSTYSGDFSSITEITPELEADGFTEDDLLTNGEPAICLFPTN